MQIHESRVDQKYPHHGWRAFLASALGAATLLAACGGGTAQTTAPRPKNLHYVTLEQWHIDPSLRLTQAAGAVAVAGDPSVKARPPRAWHTAALLGVSKQALAAALPPGGAVVELFTDPGGRVHVGALPPEQQVRLDTDQRNPDLAELAVLVGPGDADLQLGTESKTGVVTALPVQLVGGRVLELNQLAHDYPGTVTVAAA